MLKFTRLLAALAGLAVLNLCAADVRADARPAELGGFIQVKTSGSGASAVFTVDGYGFQPSALVFIQAGFGQFPTNSDLNGVVHWSGHIPGQKGTLFGIAAFDHRDGLGNPVFSNNVMVIYP